MNLYNYVSKKVKISEFDKLEGDKKELATVRKLLKTLSGIFYRDYTFFLYKENLKERKKLYDKRYDLENIQEFSIVCKNYCVIIQELLKKEFDIDSELISPYTDEFKHIDLLITTKDGNRYIVDPLSDLLEMQVGLKSNSFATENYYNTHYLGILTNIHFLTDRELEEIDDVVGYKENENLYLDELLDRTKIFLDNTFKGNEISEEIIGKKFEVLMDKIENRNNINGIVELLMYINLIIKRIFSPDEQSKIEVSTFFADEKDIQNDELKEILDTKAQRSRGVEIKIGNKIYIISLNNKFLIYDSAKWEEEKSINKIFTRPKYPVKLLNYLKLNGADRNIVHNNEFLRLFSIFENDAQARGITLEDIKKKNLSIRDGMILIRYRNHRILYKISDGNLIVEDYGENTRNIIIYQDEGRKISYVQEAILENKDREIYL